MFKYVRITRIHSTATNRERSDYTIDSFYPQIINVSQEIKTHLTIVKKVLIF